MPKFSERSLSRLKTCHTDLQIIFNEVIKTIDCTVIEGYRSQSDQDAAFNGGKSKLKYPHGKHNSFPSNAVDVAPYPVDWNNAKRFYWFAGYVMGVAYGLYVAGKIKHQIRYGGDWNQNYDITDNSFNDLVHFELVLKDVLINDQM